MAEITIQEKYCTTCKTMKDKSGFYRNRSKVDGLDVQCRDCATASRRRREKSPYRSVETRGHSQYFTVEEVSAERWLPIRGFPDYSISTLGRIKSSRSPHYGFKREPRVLPPRKAGPNGYVMIDLRADGNRLPRTLHSLVLEAFVGPCPNGMEACHNDGTKTNNRLSNLRWDTNKANHLDSVRHGTHNPNGLERGRIPRLFKYSASQLRWILANRANYSQRELSNRSGVHYSTVRRVCQGRYSPSTLD